MESDRNLAKDGKTRKTLYVLRALESWWLIFFGSSMLKRR